MRFLLGLDVGTTSTGTIIVDEIAIISITSLKIKI